jgi:hypothetical protein
MLSDRVGPEYAPLVNNLKPEVPVMRGAAVLRVVSQQSFPNPREAENHRGRLSVAAGTYRLRCIRGKDRRLKRKLRRIEIGEIFVDVSFHFRLKLVIKDTRY